MDGVTTTRRGFTVLELLLVLGVIAMLLAVLLPALAGTRAAARGTRCVANLRQMATAAHAYGLEHGVYPPAILYWSRDGMAVNEAWDWVTTFGHEVLSPGRLWSFTDNPDDVQQCPSYHGGTNFGDPHTGYNYNTTFIGGEGWFAPPNWGWSTYRSGVRPSAWRRPGVVAVFGDGGVVGNVANKFMRAPLKTVELETLPMVYRGTQAFRHLHATNVAYLDLHVAPTATPHQGRLGTETLLAAMDYPANGFLSDDDRAYDPR